jgi:hypothetical protein
MVVAFGILYGVNGHELADKLLRRVIDRPRCPKGRCERCNDVGRDAPQTCVSIPGAASKAKRRYRTCEACAHELVRQWGYVIITVITGGVRSLRS